MNVPSAGLRLLEGDGGRGAARRKPRLSSRALVGLKADVRGATLEREAPKLALAGLIKAQVLDMACG